VHVRGARRARRAACLTPPTAMMKALPRYRLRIGNQSLQAALRKVTAQGALFTFVDLSSATDTLDQNCSPAVLDRRLRPHC
jgi:hypothetical protein